MWALKNGDLDEVKDYVAKVSGDTLRWGDREAQGAPGAGAAGGDSWMPKGLGLCGPSVPGNRCVAEAAVAFLTPSGNRRLGRLDRYRPALFYTSYWNL